MTLNNSEEIRNECYNSGKSLSMKDFFKPLGSFFPDSILPLSVHLPPILCEMSSAIVNQEMQQEGNRIDSQSSNAFSSESLQNICTEQESRICNLHFETKKISTSINVHADYANACAASTHSQTLIPSNNTILSNIPANNLSSSTTPSLLSNESPRLKIKLTLKSLNVVPKSPVIPKIIFKTPSALKIQSSILSSELKNYINFLNEVDDNQIDFTISIDNFWDGDSIHHLLLRPEASLKFKFLFQKVSSLASFNEDSLCKTKSFVARFLKFKKNESSLEKNILHVAFTSTFNVIDVALALFSGENPKYIKTEELMVQILESMIFFLQHTSLVESLTEDSHSLLFGVFRRFKDIILDCAIDESHIWALFKGIFTIVYASSIASKTCFSWQKEAVYIFAYFTKKIPHLSQYFIEEVVRKALNEDSSEIFSDSLLLSFENQQINWFFFLLYELILVTPALSCDSFLGSITKPFVETPFQRDRFWKSKEFLDKFLGCCFSLALDLVSFPSAEYFLRKLSFWLIKFFDSKSAVFSQMDYLSKSKLVEITTSLSTFIIDLSKKSVEIIHKSRNCIISFVSKLFYGKYPSAQFHFNDWAISTEELQSVDSNSIYDSANMFYAKPFFEMLDNLIQILISSCSDQNLIVKCRALKGLAALIEKNPLLLNQPSIVSIIGTCINDASPTIREAAADIIGEIIQSNSQNVKSVELYCKIVFSKCCDSSPIVRKKALKIVESFLDEVFSNQNLVSELLHLFMKLLNLSFASDDSVQKIAVRVLSKMFTLPYEISNRNLKISGLSTKNIDYLNLLSSSVESCVQKVSFIDLFNLNDSFKFISSEMIDLLIENWFRKLLDARNMSNNNEILILSSLDVFLKHFSTKISTFYLILQNQIYYYSENRAKLEECRLCLSILQKCIPFLPHDTEFFKKMEKILILFILKWPEVHAEISMSCLISLSLRSKNTTILLDIQSKFGKFISDSQPNVRNRALVNLINLVTGGFDVNIFEAKEIEKLYSYCLLSESEEKYSTIVSAFCIGKLLGSLPEIGLRLKDAGYFKRVLQSNQPSIVVICLKAFYNMLKKNHSDKLSNYCCGLIQGNISDILHCSFEDFEEIQWTIVSILKECFDKSFLHPASYIPYVFAFCVSKYESVCLVANELWKKITIKHRQIIYSISPLEFMSFSFRLQTKGSFQNYLHEFFFIDYLSSTTQGSITKSFKARKLFLKHVISAFEFDKNSMKSKSFSEEIEKHNFRLFIVKVISCFPFERIDEVCSAIVLLQKHSSIHLDDFTAEDYDAINDDNFAKIFITYVIVILQDYLIKTFSIDYVKLEEFSDTSNTDLKQFEKNCTKNQDFPNPLLSFSFIEKEMQSCNRQSILAKLKSAFCSEDSNFKTNFESFATPPSISSDIKSKSKNSRRNISSIQNAHTERVPAEYLFNEFGTRKKQKICYAENNDNIHCS